MRGLTEITSQLASERENRDYLDARISRWETALSDVTPGTPEHTKIVNRLVRMNVELDETEQNIRLLRAERDQALTTTR